VSCLLIKLYQVFENSKDCLTITADPSSNPWLFSLDLIKLPSNPSILFCHIKQMTLYSCVGLLVCSLSSSCSSRVCEFLPWPLDLCLVKPHRPTFSESPRPLWCRCFQTPYQIPSQQAEKPRPISTSHTWESEALAEGCVRAPSCSNWLWINVTLNTTNAPWV